MKDRCVLCGRETQYDVNTPIDMRRGYEPGSGQQCPDGCLTKSDGSPIDPEKVIRVEPLMISDAFSSDGGLLIKTLKAIAITVMVFLTWIVCIAAIHYLYTQFINVVK